MSYSGWDWIISLLPWWVIAVDFNLIISAVSFYILWYNNTKLSPLIASFSYFSFECSLRLMINYSFIIYISLCIFMTITSGSATSLYLITTPATSSYSGLSYSILDNDVSALLKLYYNVAILTSNDDINSFSCLYASSVIYWLISTKFYASFRSRISLSIYLCSVMFSSYKFLSTITNALF